MSTCGNALCKTLISATHSPSASGRQRPVVVSVGTSAWGRTGAFAASFRNGPSWAHSVRTRTGMTARGPTLPCKNIKPPRGKRG